MTYRVILTDAVFEVLESQARYLAVEQQAPEAAARWLKQVLAASETLATMPRRCALAPENELRSYEVRWLGVGSFMLLFTVVDSTRTVWVVGARHGRRLPRPRDLPAADDLGL